VSARKINEAIATGRAYVNYDPLAVLKELRDWVSWIPVHGFVIKLGAHDDYPHKRLTDCIAFHEGKERP
jgi:hypothetical protein